MRRIEKTFAKIKKEGGGGLIPFITAGDPNLDVTRELIIELAQAGATIIELGVPFSDPMADGPVIQRSSARALRNDCAVKEILQMIGEVRRQTEVPIVLFNYYNPLLQFGRTTRQGSRARRCRRCFSY